ncbi:LamG-like jellyroll fold domain-containing protein [Haloplanus salinarum]|uniref:LamG-like jellyroll fold domain-containing protein n=1 Tax=Haloplanus salinarum TaxID=1912324 RepID=UPI003B438D76
MADLRSATADLLERHPRLEEDLQALLEIDNDGPWEFGDIPLDSGDFGEVVSAGIVEEADGQYRIADRSAVKMALDSEPSHETTKDTSEALLADLSLPSVHRRAVLALVGALVVVFVVRVIFMYGSVFRNGDIVLAGNDPYLYRYWGEQLVASNLGVFEIGSLDRVSERIPTHDTLYIVAVWWASALFGGNGTAVGTVLAWGPVLAGVVTALLVYLLSVRLTEDRRIGLAAILLLAVTPAHAFRSGLGFGDHHAFNYFWVGMTALSLVVLVGARANDEYLPSSPAEWLAVLGLGIGIAAQAHSWRAGPLLSIPVGLYLAGRVALDVRDGRSPLGGNVPVLLGVGFGAVLTLFPHLLFNWAPFYRAFAPALLAVGGLFVVGIGMAGYHAGLSARALVAGQTLGGLLTLGAAFAFLPDFSSAFDQLIAYFVRTGQSGIAETYSIFSGDLGSVVGPIFLFGFVFFIAVPYMLWGVRVAISQSRPDWLAVVAYGVYFLVLAVIQSRFAGQLSLFTAIFGGLGFLHLATLIDVAERPIVLSDDGTTHIEKKHLREPNGGVNSGLQFLSLPADRQTLGVLVILFFLVVSPGAVLTGVKQSQVAVDTGIYETATWIDGYAETQDQTYPENYVLSPWGRNRVYNYFVNGESESYAYAQQYYGSFITSREPEQWYAQLSAKPTGYVVVKPPGDGANPRPETMQSRLWTNWGSATAEVSGTSHYRAVYANEERKVYELVPGATLVSAAPPNSSATVSTEVSLSEHSFTYERKESSTAGGATAVTVPYPGEYSVGDATITVDSNAVEQGDYVIDNRLRRPGAPTEVARWTFNEQLDEFAIDRVGNSHGEIQGNPRYRSGASGAALAFDGEDDEVEINDEHAPEIGNSSFTLSFWIRGDLDEASTQYPAVIFNRNNSGYGLWARNDVNDFGVRIDDTDGDSVPNFGIKTTEFSSWTHIVVTLDRTDNELRLYRNSTLVQTSSTESLDTVASNASLFIGSRGGADYAPVEIDNLRMYNDTLNKSDISRSNRA